MKERSNELQSYNASLRFLPFTNTTGEAIPPHALLELEGANEYGFIALKPRTNGCFCFLNGPATIPNGKRGQAYAGLEGLKIATDGTAGAGEEWGAEAGSWEAVFGNSGFVIMADGEAGFADARRSVGSSSSGSRTYVRITAVDDYGSGYGLDRTRVFTARPVTFLADGGVLDIDAGGGLDFSIAEEDEHNLVLDDQHAYPVETDSNGFQRINIGPLAGYDADQPRYTPGIMGVGQKQYFRGVKIFGGYGGANTDNVQGNVWSEAVCWLGAAFATVDDITSCRGWASVAQAYDGDGFTEDALTFFVANLNPDVTVKNGDESAGGAGGVPGMTAVQFFSNPASGAERVGIRFGNYGVIESFAASGGGMKFSDVGFWFAPSGGAHTGYMDIQAANIYVWSDASTQHTGWSGTFTTATKTVTVVHGLITNVA